MKHKSILLALGAVLLVTLIMLGTTSGLASGSYSSSGIGAAIYAVSTPNPEYKVTNASAWLDGHGVDVYYTPNKDDYHPTDGADRILYECAELAQRLYNELGYPAHWPVNDAFEMWDMKDANGKRRIGFEDLLYYPNGGQTRPRPGDIIVWPSSDIGRSGHVAIVSRVAGNGVEIVQQNVWWPDSNRNQQKHPIESLKLSRDNQGRYTLSATWTRSTPSGWIHSPRMDSLLTISKMKAVSEGSNFGQFQWNRDRDTVYVYLSPKATVDLYNDSKNTSRVAAQTLTMRLSFSKALSLTNSAYVSCVVMKISDIIKNKYTLSDIKSLDFTLKYTGPSIWMRAWWKSGSSSNSGWQQVDGISCSWDGSSYK